MTTVKIKQGDLQRGIVLFLETEAGAPVTNLNEAAEITFDMRPAATETKTITGRAATITDLAAGEITVDLEATDTVNPGLYLAEVLVEWQANEPQTFPADGFIEIYIVPDLQETPARTAARVRVETAAATGSDPALDSAAVAGILERARRADTAGRAPGDDGWVETYDVLDATIEAWEAKAAAAACRTDLTRGSLKVARNQVLDNCLRMAAMLRARRTGSAAMTGPNGNKVIDQVYVGNGPDLVEPAGIPGAAGRFSDEWTDL